MYIKINEEGNIISKADSKVLRIGHRVITNPKDCHYRAAGYLPVIEEDMLEPQEGYSIETYYQYSDDNNSILKSYRYVEIPIVEENIEPEEPIEENIIEDAPIDEDINDIEEED